jgi:succinate-semialdehyde dehydrogenase/glutarate-semialdehyde dehydrogenase
MALKSINPATGELVKSFEPLDDAAIEERLARSEAAFREYRKTTLHDRKRWMQRTAEILVAEAEELGRIATTEMGKTLRSAVEEVRKCARGCTYYAEEAGRILADERVATEAAASYVRYDPIGPILAVMPWNFPYWQVFRFAAPALMAGNVALLKHASNVPQCALAIEDVLRRAGFPDAVFQTLLIGSEQVERVLDDSRVVAATLTGSDRAGRSVAGTAGRQLKKTVLELGGSDPFVVMPSADLEAAVATAVKARTINNGQSCIAAKRFIVADEIYDEFERRFVETMANLRVGDPMLETTDLGPLATSAIRDDLADQVERARAAGAGVLTGGNRVEGPGYFFEPTVIAGLPRSADVYREETFGPLAALFRVRDASEAIAVANDTPFGLGASVWTGDADEEARFVREIEAGQVFVNDMVASDPRLPFGGVKQSGYGRELSAYGPREFVNIKTVWVKRL